MNSILQQIYDGVLEGNRPAVTLKIQEAIQAGVPPEEILNSMTRSMEKVGSLFEEGEYFVPEMLIAARAMQQGMEILRPRLVDRDAKSSGCGRRGHGEGRPSRNGQEFGLHDARNAPDFGSWIWAWMWHRRPSSRP